MEVYRDINTVGFVGAVATIGIFDGVHLAHKAILEKVINKAAEKKVKSLLITMWPHPRYVLNKDAGRLNLISSLEEKIDRLSKTGLGSVLILPFNAQLADTSFEDFVKEYFIDKLKLSHIVVGYNHHFGKNRQGNYESLKAFASPQTFEVEQLQPFLVDGQRVSSTKVRECIQIGDIELANRFLGHAFAISGKVQHGEKMGRHLGFPTANIELPSKEKIIPALGVYAVQIEFEGKLLNGMANIGSRPTVSEKGQSLIEVNIFNFNSDIYNRKIRILFLKRMRLEKKFKNIQALKEQITRDKFQIEKYFSKINES